MSAFRMGAEIGRQRMMTVKLDAATVTAVTAGTPGPVEVRGTVDEGETRATADLVHKAADVYTKWLPGDVLAAYLALTAAFRGTLDPTASSSSVTPHAWGVLVAGIALAAGLVLLGAISGRLGGTVSLNWLEIVGRMALACIAFGFWSLTTPGAWWEVKGWDAGVLAAIAFAASIVFALVAEIVVAVLRPGSP